MWKLLFGAIKSEKKNLFSCWKLGPKLLHFIHAHCLTEENEYFTSATLQKNKVNGPK